MDNEFNKRTLADEMSDYLNYLKRTPLLEYHTKPLYGNFKSSWARTIGYYFRFFCFILSIILTVRLVLDFELNFWWYLELALLAPIVVINTILFIMDIAYKIRVELHNEKISTDTSIRNRSGPPGSGKTSSVFYDGRVMADKMWLKIILEYKLLEPYLDEIPFWPEQLREDAEEIIEAFEFYQTSGTVPCLWSSVPSFVDGIPANRLTAEHLNQKKKLPYGSVLVIDEIRLILPQEMFRNRAMEIIEMCKFPRHFGEFKWCNNDQGRNSMLKDLRDSAGENITMIKQAWVLKPRLLIWFYNFLIINTKHLSKAQVCFLKTLDKIIKSIGYRKYWFYDTGTEERRVMGKVQTFILPPYLNITYDSRAFKNAYRCKNKKPEVSSWEHLRLTRKEVDEIFIKDFDDLKKKKEEKKSTQKRKSKEQIYD